jgi:hypothetical protein
MIQNFYLLIIQHILKCFLSKAIDKGKNVKKCIVSPRNLMRDKFFF